MILLEVAIRGPSESSRADLVEDPEFAATMDTSDIPDGKWVYNSAWDYEWDEECFSRALRDMGGRSD